MKELAAGGLAVVGPKSPSKLGAAQGTKLRGKDRAQLSDHSDSAKTTPLPPDALSPPVYVVP